MSTMKPSVYFLNGSTSTALAMAKKAMEQVYVTQQDRDDFAERVRKVRNEVDALSQAWAVRVAAQQMADRKEG